MESITFVCLSKSKKNHDYCVAGKILKKDGTYGGWIRPINQYGTINDENCSYENGESVSWLHVVTAEFIEKKPQKFQTENHLINEESHWKHIKNYEYEKKELMHLCDNPNTLWVNNHQTNSGKFDQVSPEEVKGMTESLYFIFVDELTFYSTRWQDEKIKLRGEFTYKNVTYNLKVTDLYWLNHYETEPLGSHILKEKFLTVSLALDTYTNVSGTFHYKILAEVL
ncbi:hypothetical protein H0261_14815 [Pectobacterium versatile]|uniref:dual OB domain-containing protein n=1 Tax=Pectobacterium TaxID=122277 RepID=UPI0015E03E81|nr:MULTISPECIES: hypothetical protein [Pectobacterium]MBA0185009.1 hypothetical protein [Pectobacterium versatile]MBB1526566.1 hypothetical protein [Pectobacterium carotovorum subsp. carotovorum]MCA6967287.1 hypothetical protein [Pectobacterium carotovorum]MCH4989707.1 hypothetical protein [Pectobacterium carotovorum]